MAKALKTFDHLCGIGSGQFKLLSKPVKRNYCCP